MKLRQSLVKKYESLDPLVKQMVQVMSVAGTPMSRSDLASLAGDAGVRRKDGRKPEYKLDRDALNHAIDAEVLQYVSKTKTGKIDVAAEVLDIAFEEAFRGGLAKSVVECIPDRMSVHSLYHKPRETVLREMRMFCYGGEFDKWQQYRSQYHYHPNVLCPFRAETFQHLSPEFQSFWVQKYSLKTVAIASFWQAGFLDHVDHYLDSLKKVPEETIVALIDLFCVQGNLDGLRNLQRKVQPLRSDIEASICFLEGDFETARDKFESAATETRKRTKKRNVAFKHIPSLFYGVLLLKENSPQSQKKLAQLVKTVDKWESEYWSIGHALSFGLLQQVNPLSDGRTEFDESESKPIGIVAAGLIGCWLFRGKKLPFEKKIYLDLLDGYRQAGLSWIAAECSAIVASVEENKTNSTKHRKFSNQTHKQLGTVSLIDFIKPAPAWEAALKRIENLCNGELAAGSTNAATTNDQRMIWELNYSKHDSWLDLTPYIQKLAAKGWTKGRKVSLGRLFEQWNTGEFDFLTDQDREICRCLTHTYDRNYYGYREDNYEWSQKKIGKAIVGHPQLYHAGDRQHPVEVTETSPHIAIEQTKGKSLKLSIQPKGNGERSILEEGSHRLSICEFSDQQIEIAELMDKLPLIPASQQERVSEMAHSISSIFAVRSSIDGALSSGESVDPLSNVFVQLTPYQDGLRAELFVQPLGPEGPFCRPGAGAPSVFANIENKPLTTTRDLAAEKANLKSLLDSCRPLDARTIGDQQTEWLFHESEDALELVMELQALAEQEKVSVLWPRGKTHDVAGSASSSSFHVSVRRDKDWFAASGKLHVDDELTIDMMKLLELVDASPSRFVSLDDGRFLALTDELRKRIADIAAFGSPMKNKLRFAPIRALAVDDLLEEANTKTDKHWKNHIARIEEAGAIDIKPPTTLQTELRDYQSEGFGWLKRLAHWNTGACLADDMGLGKTIQALALLIQRASDGPALVVAPASVGFNWENEARKFAPTLTPKLFRDCDRAAFFEDIQPGDLVITSYGLLQSEVERFADVHWSTILLDEAQAIKNADTKRSQAAMQLNGDFKMILTGTPLENHLGEVWNLFRFIVPGLLGTNADFRKHFALPIERDQCRATRNRLRKLIQPFLLRRTKSEVLSELPPRSESLLEVELSPQEVALYEALRCKALEKINNVNESDKSKGEKHLQVLAELTRLRLACCHPSLVGGEGIESAKLNLFRQKVTEIVEGKHRALVFSQFVKHLSILRDELDSLGISYQYLDGSTPAKKRKQIVEAFQAGEGDVFLISLKAGGTGLNLTAADYVIHMDPWWNPAVEDQATDRAHRIGQQRPVNVYRLVTRGTIEEKIVDLHHTKRDLADSLLSGTNISAKLSTDDLIDLLHESSEPVPG